MIALPMRSRHAVFLVVSLLTVAAFVIRWVNGTKQGLGVDEIFSLAIATGHSVEQSTAKTRPELGDFMQAPQVQPAESYHRFIQHERPPAGFARVVRAVFLSDTNPPLYYLLLNLWTRLGGTSDMALRLLSILISALSVPLCYMLGRRLYDRRTGLIAATFFTLAPQAVFHGTEGRMYAMIVAITLVTALLTLRLHRRPSISAAIAWIVCSAAGLLTHYFFVFPWVAMLGWLLAFPHRLRRSWILGAVAVVLVAVTPWYIGLPDSMANWRVTRGWLEGRPRGFVAVKAQIRLLSGYFVVAGDWLTREGRLDYVLMAVFGLVSAAGLRFRRAFPRMKATWLLVAWLLAVNLGLLTFDLLQDTYARNHSRYAYAGLPAALMLAAALLARVPVRLRVAALAVIVSIWAGGLLRLNAEPRGDNPFKSVATDVNTGGSEGRVVIIHAIPTSVLGHARYLDPEIMMLDWVAEHRTRTDADAARARAGARRITVIVSHSMQISPEERYFAPRADSVHRKEGRGYRLADFFLAAPGDSSSGATPDSATPPHSH